MSGRITKIKQIHQMDFSELLRLEEIYLRQLARIRKRGRVNTPEYEKLSNCIALVQLQIVNFKGDERCRLGGSHARIIV